MSLSVLVSVSLDLYFSASYGQTNGFALQEPFQIILNFISEHPLKNVPFYICQFTMCAFMRHIGGWAI